jgi:7-cyano-7-deazaguanine synthase in queuosine biosynthesis
MTEQVSNEKKKRPLLLFSGGLDSTCMLGQQLEYGDVDTLYVRGPQGRQKAAAELRARKHIFEWFAKNSEHQVRTDYVVDLEKFGLPIGYRYGQALAWFTAAMNTCDSLEHSKVMIGYGQGDQIIPMLGHLSAAWDALAVVVKEKAVGLHFPVMELSKLEMLKQMPTDLYELTWVCEYPDTSGQPCLRCLTCITRAGEEYKLGLINYTTIQQLKPRHGSSTQPTPHRAPLSEDDRKRLPQKQGAHP